MSKRLTAEQLFEAANSAGLIIKVGGGWLAIGDQKVGQGRDKAIQSIDENEELRVALEAALKVAAPETVLKSGAENAAALSKPGGGTDSGDENDSAQTATTIDVSFPLPADIPHNALSQAIVVVTSKSDYGFRRAGYAFTPAETLIPYSEISTQKLDTIVYERELVVKLRVARPG